MNNVSLTGRIATAPEIKDRGDSSITTFCLAVDSRRDNEEPDWVPIEVWGKVAKAVHTHKNVGDQLAITGRITTSSWTDDTGDKKKRVYITAQNIEFLQNKKTNTTKEATN